MDGFCRMISLAYPMNAVLPFWAKKLAIQKDFYAMIHYLSINGFNIFFNNHMRNGEFA